MKAFAELFTALDATTKTLGKVGAMADYFRVADATDAAWAVYFLTGRKLRQVVPSKKLREWAAAEVGIPEWLLTECYDAVGDAAETVALLLPESGGSTDRSLADWVENVLIPFRGAEETEQRVAMLNAWSRMDRTQRLVWNKLVTGAFRVGVSQQLVTRALARVAALEPEVVAHRLMGEWSPTRAFFLGLLDRDSADADVSRPYPFCLAHGIEGEPADSLGEVSLWQAEWKWDGIRCQLIRRKGQSYLWTRGEELVTDRYPEISGLGSMLPDGTVIDGEILPMLDGRVLAFSQLQRRIGRKTLGKKILAEVPVSLVAFDLMERGGVDIRERPLSERRAWLESLVEEMHAPRSLLASPLVASTSWEDLAEARRTCRDRNAEGLMVKRLDSPYRVGRVRGEWWKWKIAPYTVDAVLTAAQRGSGKRASLYTDYTFSVWDSDQGRLVPIAKAYSGLTDEEIRGVDAWIRRNMVEKFGPVRTVAPELVFELAFEGIQRSPRHKSGIAVRFPRILRQRTDKAPADADTLESLRGLLADETR